MFNNAGKRDVLILCDFDNLDKIKEIQSKYYDIGDKVPPHIAVTFPFDSDISDDELYEKLYNILSKYNSFDIVLHGISTPVNNSNYRFLNIIKNKDIIKKISDDIYNNIIPEQLEYRDSYNYEPHVSISNLPLKEDINLDDYFYMKVSKFYVEKIGLNDESIKIFEIDVDEIKKNKRTI